MEEVKYIPGDLVKFKDKVQAITNIDRQTSYRIEISMENGICVCKLEDIETHISPIPLTSEILKKNGWKKYICISEIWYSDEVFIGGDKDDEKSYIYFELHHKGNCWDIFQRDKLLRKGIKYVHQLQHLLFGLGLDSNLKV